MAKFQKKMNPSQNKKKPMTVFIPKGPAVEGGSLL